MDVDVLISEVFLRPPLWDKLDKNHHNRYELDKLWNEVAQQLKTKPSMVRNKWKTLRDKFRTTLASLPRPKSGDAQKPADYKGEWSHFKKLFFLKDQFTPRKSSGNFGVTNNESILEEFDGGDNANEEQPDLFTEPNICASAEDGNSNTSLPFRSSTTSSVQSRQSSKRSIGSELVQLEKDKLQYLRSKAAKKEEDDEDLSFFKSLLPHVRTFSAFEKLEYRMKVMRITQEFMKPGDINSSTSPNGPVVYRLASNSHEIPTTRFYYEHVEENLQLPEQQTSVVNVQ